MTALYYKVDKCIPYTYEDKKLKQCEIKTFQLKGKCCSKFLFFAVIEKFVLEGMNIKCPAMYTRQTWGR